MLKRYLSGKYLGRVLLFILFIFATYLPHHLNLYVSTDQADKLWTLYGVPAMRPIFADLRGVTAPLECFREYGLGVYEHNHCDYWSRPFNYPRTWFLFSYLGVSQSWTVPLGIVLIVLLGGGIAFVGGLSGWPGVLLSLPLVLSPPMALLVERVNNDIVVFLLLIVSAVWLLKGGIKELFGYGGVLVAALLKLYPCFAFLSLLRVLTKRSVDYCIFVVYSFSVYVVLFREDLDTIDRNTKSPEELAYGAKILFDHFFGESLPFDNGKVGVILVIGVFGIAFLLGRFLLKGRLMNRDEFKLEQILFLCGAGIFLGTFILDSNYYYRLVFLILCVPLISQLLISGRQSFSLFAGLMGIVMFGQFWFEYFSATRAFLLDEWMNWINGLSFSLVCGALTFRAADRENGPETALN